MNNATAIASTFRQRLHAGHRPFWLRRLHSLTGVLLGVYVVFHLLINATLVEGYRQGAFDTVYQKQVSSIHTLPFLRLFVWALIYLPIVFHIVYGLWLTYLAKPNVNQYPYGKNVFYLFQRVSGVFLGAFIVFHVGGVKGWWSANLKFDPWRATETAVNHLTASWIIGWFVYPVGILSACYHVAYGFWTAAITWGLTVSAGSQRRWGWACVGIFAVLFVCGMMALVAALTPAATARHG